MATKAIGIHQSDLIIRTAIVEALADIKRNPWLLDYVFRSLVDDGLTSGVYGEREVAAAKKWLLSHDVPVFMNTRLDDTKLPAISIGLQESTEAEQTHGDVNSDPVEDADSESPILVGPFTPVSYDGVTGILVIPDDVIGDRVLLAGMVILDRTGVAYPILDVDQTSISIEPGTDADFTNAVIKDTSGSLAVSLESMSFRESYQIGIHVQSEPVYLTYLHSLMVFILAGRYKQALLEARGFERSTISSSAFLKNDVLGVENAFSRFITITGWVRHYWPKYVSSKLTSVSTGAASDSVGVSFGKEGTSGPGINDAGQPMDEDDAWGVDEDALAGVVR